MKIALTVWEDRISPVFDAARNLLIVEIRGKKIINRQYQTIVPEVSSRLAMILGELGVNVIICGAISQFSAIFIESSRIQLIPFVSGNVEEIIRMYVKDGNVVPAFLMPGCGRPHARRKNQEEFFNQQKEVMVMPGRNGTGLREDGSASGKGRGGCMSDKKAKNPGHGRGLGRGSRKGRGDRK